MKYTKFTALVAIALVVTGCASRRPQKFTPLPFDEAEYGALQTEGTGIVRGQVFAKTRGGEVRKGAGESVVMFPATKYGNQRYTEQVLGGKLSTTPEDPRYQKYAFTKKTDGDGKFEFSNVPSGDYYVVSNVSWSVFVPGVLGPIEKKQGGTVSMKIEVKNGVVTDAFLTK